MMRTESLLQLVQDALVDAKGQDIRMLDVRKITDITDYMLIVNGTSNRHIVSMSEKVIERAREHGRKPIGVEGQDLGDWVLIDFGDVVVHLMRPQTREFYSLEKLWGGAEKPNAAEV
ncbi:MAG: ribosome silencing factor [Acidiferrobacterales bacterium]|jgi:ribosome-associated protein